MNSEHNKENLQPEDTQEFENTCAYCDEPCKGYTCGSRACEKSYYHDMLDD